ncbi:MAG: monofunctional biosynthetic peptidoglycan transglycosylase [Chitinivibrionales bacterium]|nr:monofunctional biosynthetic peptidoglycan transglycosylase [Chitinivibrionales bacterium]
MNIENFSVKKVIGILFKIIKSIFLLYAVLFSLAGTAAIFYAYKFVTRPVNEVKSLAHTAPPASVYMKKREADLKKAARGDSIHHTFIPFDSISPYLKNAVIASEDDGFYLHPGFDIRAIAKAFEKNVSRNKLKYGGSTITQQLAKNLFLSGERTFARKIKELIYTILLERYLTKDRILELYLNYAQWGKNIFGCEAAAQKYFKKSCINLTLWEAARMAAVLAKPATMTPHYTKSKFMWKRLRVIAENLYQRKLIDDSGYTTLTGIKPPEPEVNWQDTITAPDTGESLQP